MSTDTLKRSLYQSLAKVAQTLANANRLQLLEFIAQGERSVEELATMAGLSIANTSQHLQGLRQAGLIVPRKDGQRVFYSIAGKEVVQLYSALRRAGEAHAAEVEKLVRDFLGHRDELEPVRAEELLARAKKGLVTVLDVRPAEEFAAGHLPGALNVPIDKLESSLAKLPKSREVVAYCRGPYCLMSFEAVSKLRKRGWKARRLEGGFPEWKAAGLPVE
ncbi:MAG TPA: metalloregulator ArsR/SmtB family transcription factor [Burkholderiaceae bacterium]|jgi:rhodanese-related sulfurtransferase/predicted transcriptional regulator|nr:metalloregulator ArsR/SmtB family transcription factor [Burkholderiaceae bacterium]